MTTQKARPAYRKTRLVDCRIFCNKIRNGKDDENRRSIKTVDNDSEQEVFYADMISAVDRGWRTQLAHNPQLEWRLPGCYLCFQSNTRAQKLSFFFMSLISVAPNKHGNGQSERGLIFSYFSSTILEDSSPGTLHRLQMILR